MTYRGVAVGIVLALILGASAQETRLRVSVDAESVQLRSRLLAIDALTQPPRPVETAVAIVGQLTSGAAMPALATAAAHEPNLERWQTALDRYYRLGRAAEDALVALPEGQPGWSGAMVSVQLRGLVQRRLAGLPRAILDEYRDRVDAEAQQLLDEGRRMLSPEPLRRIVTELRCSRQAVTALDLLGDLAFEQGDFDDALAWWRCLAQPDVPPHDTALFEAKRILVLAVAGRQGEADRELDIFEQRHSAARGHLAGRDDVYAVTLRDVLKRSGGVGQDCESWTTFAGSPSRNSSVSSSALPSGWCVDGPAWRKPLAPLSGSRLGWTAQAAYHPVIAAGRVIVAGPTEVAGYDLRTGADLFRYDPAPDMPAEREPTGPGRRPRRPRYCLTVDGDRAYVRVGQQMLGPGRGERREAGSFLVCLDVAAAVEGKEPLEVWRVRAPGTEAEPGFFEGAPLVHRGAVYIALSRLAGRRTQTAVACYDRRGRLRWLRDVGACPEFEDDASPREQHHLLTWGSNQLIYCTHAGAVAALDPWTGAPLWCLRYPGRGPLAASSVPSPRDLAPCLHVDGRILVAPLDAARLYCLEAASGRVLWEHDVEVVHLLGASAGMVCFTTPGGLEAVSLADGASVWRQPAEGRLPGLGRGLILGRRVLWPTQDAHLPIRAVALFDDDLHRQAVSGAVLEPTEWRGVPAGNLAFAEDCLVVAGPDELVVFAPPQTVPLPPPVPVNRLTPRAPAESVLRGR